MCSSALFKPSALINGPTATPSSKTVAGFQRAGLLDKFRQKLFVNGALDINAVRRDARLAGVSEFEVIIVPSTAASRSASSKTKTGAWPPSSKRQRLDLIRRAPDEFLANLGQSR